MPLCPRNPALLLLLLLATLGTERAFAQKAGTPSSNQNERWFDNVTRKAGVNFRHHTRNFENAYAEIMQGYTKLSAAAAVADTDKDRFEDIFVNDSCTTCKNRLYHNNADFTFTDVAERAAAANGNDAENASAGALWFAFNNDGLPDIFVVRFGH